MQGFPCWHEGIRGQPIEYCLSCTGVQQRRWTRLHTYNDSSSAYTLSHHVDVLLDRSCLVLFQLQASGSAPSDATARTYNDTSSSAYTNRSSVSGVTTGGTTGVSGTTTGVSGATGVSGMSGVSSGTGFTGASGYSGTSAGTSASGVTASALSCAPLAFPVVVSLGFRVFCAPALTWKDP